MMESGSRWGGCKLGIALDFTGQQSTAALVSRSGNMPNCSPGQRG